MTVDGIPETERELTLAGLDGVSARDLGLDPGDGCLSLVEAAERLGVPVLVLQRWCGDGTVTRELRDGTREVCFRGRAQRPGALRIERAWVDEVLERREVVL